MSEGNECTWCEDKNVPLVYDEFDEVYICKECEREIIEEGEEIMREQHAVYNAIVREGLSRYM